MVAIVKMALLLSTPAPVSKMSVPNPTPAAGAEVRVSFWKFSVVLVPAVPVELIWIVAPPPTVSAPIAVVADVPLSC